MGKKKNGVFKQVDLIGVPMDLGADLRGVDMGPSAIRIAGLEKNLRSLKIKVRDQGNLPVPHASVAGPSDAKLKFIKPIRAACEQLAASVDSALARKSFPLVLGGDHSIAIGSVAGVLRHAKRERKKYGLLWVDAHGDCNTRTSTPSGNIHGMSLAASLGMGDKKLLGLGGRGTKIKAEHTVLLSVRNLDRGEKRNLKKLGIRAITMRDIDEYGVYSAALEALRVVTNETDGFHLSFDIDCMDPRFAPGVGTPVSGGLTVREAHLIMELVADSQKMISCEMVEVNPVLDHENTTAKLAVALLYSAFGGQIL